MEQTREKRPERTQTNAQNECGKGMSGMVTTSDTNCRERKNVIYAKGKSRVRMSMRNERKSVGTR